ncbi:hypothetical protein LGK95_12260 [Clostridium algoriphilum]|nr:hypothetical protein [Clostridium algoriphilum]MCB2294289.1 hypothetical protein [Clostridium algoriphilum]
MRLEGCPTVASQLGVEKAMKALISQDDEILQRSNNDKLKSNSSTI